MRLFCATAVGQMFVKKACREIRELAADLPKDIEEINLMLDKIEMILELHLWVEGDGDQ